MRTTIAIVATFVSCGSTEHAAVTVSRPIHRSKCAAAGLRAGPKPQFATAPVEAWAVPLQLCAFRDGFELCNPSGEPIGMTGFWQISPVEVATIDSALLVFLHRQMSGGDVRDLERYGRQYLGFFRGARRYVFINAFPPELGVTRETSETEVLGVCDNGWGIEYDVGAQQFAKLTIDHGPPGQ